MKLKHLSCIDCIHFEVCAPDRIRGEPCELFHPYCEGCKYGRGVDIIYCQYHGKTYHPNYFCKQGEQ